MFQNESSHKCFQSNWNIWIWMYFVENLECYTRSIFRMCPVELFTFNTAVFTRLLA